MEEHRTKRLKTASDDASSNAVLPPIPVFKTQDVSLNEDVMAKILVEMLDPASHCTATALSKEHHAALIPRQTHVWLGGFKTCKAFHRMNFAGMTFFSLRKCHFVTDRELQSIDANAFPKLQGVDFTNTGPVTSLKIAKFIEFLGPRLKAFVFCRSFVPDCIRSALVRHASNLTSLKLSIYGSDLANLKSLTSLRELSVETFSYYLSNLPESVQVLRIKRGCPSFEWKRLKNASLPNLVNLEITDKELVTQFNAPNRMIPARSDLSADFLIVIMSKAPKLKSFQLDALSTRAPLYQGKATEQEERLFRYMQERAIKYIGPEHVTEACGASAAMFQQWRDQRK